MGRTSYARSRVLGRLMATVLAVCLLGLLTGAPHARAVTDPAVVDLGTAMEVTDVGATATGPDLDGGTLLYVTAAGQPPTFTVLDAETNEVVYQQVMEGEEFVTSAIVDTPGGLTYFGLRSGSSTQIYVYDVAAKTVEPVLRTCRTCEISKTVFRVFEVAEDGTLFLGSYPDAAVYSYNPKTKEVRDYGSVFTDGEYVWGLTLADDQLFVGTGNGPGLGRLFQVDTVSGAITQIPFPDGAVTPSVIGELQVIGDHLLVPMAGDAMQLRIYNHATKQWECSGVAAPGFPQPTDAFDSDTAGGLTYFRTGSEIYELEPSACRYTKVFDLAAAGLADEGFNSVKIIFEGAEDAQSVSKLVMFATQGRSLVIDPATGAHEVRDSNVLASPITTHAIGEGPDGKVYIGAYLSPHVMGQLDPATNEVTVLEGPEQSDSATTIAGRLVVTSYPNAVVHSADVNKPWSWDGNPVELFRGAEHQQDRILEVVAAGRLGVHGSIPKYGVLGGGLTVFHPVTGEHQTYREPLGQQSTGALAYRKGVVHVGTTTQGGIGGNPDPNAEAFLFTFDLDTRTAGERVVPVPGAKTIGGLAYGKGRHLWGVTDTGTLFKYDPSSRMVLDTVQIPGGAGGTNWGRLPDLQFNRTDGLFYGLSATRQLFTFDPVTRSVRIIDDEHHWVAMKVLTEGQVYLVDDSHVFVIDPR